MMTAYRVHGGVPPEERTGCDLDLSVCVNPWGPPDGVRAAIANVDVTCYPDVETRAGRAALSSWLDYPSEAILLGNGAAELLWSVARALLTAGSRVVVCQPCFSEFEAAAHACQARVKTFSSEQLDGGVVAQSLFHAMRSYCPEMIYLCAPSSPLGAYVDPGVYVELAQQFPDVVVLVDQSYLGLSHHAEELNLRRAMPTRGGPANLVLVRSLTKELGTPGVRTGYALIAPALAERVNAQRPAWTVSAAAEAAVVAYPHVQSELVQRREQLLALAHELGEGLTALGYQPSVTDTLYQVARVPSQLGSAAELRRRLLSEHRVAIRDCASFGLPNHFRISAHPQQAIALTALTAVRGDSA